MNHQIDDNTLAQIARQAYETNPKTNLQLWTPIGTYNVSGVHAHVYEHNRFIGLCCCAFKGTSTFRDVVADLGLVLGQDLAGYIQAAQTIAAKVTSDYKDVIFTGHSLGATLAAIAQWTSQGNNGSETRVWAFAPFLATPSISSSLFQYSWYARILYNPGDLVSLTVWTQDRLLRPGAQEAHWVQRGGLLANLGQDNPIGHAIEQFTEDAIERENIHDELRRSTLTMTMNHRRV